LSLLGLLLTGGPANADHDGCDQQFERNGTGDGDMSEPFLCMICVKEKNDSPTGGEEDEYGDYWTYCRDCDVWTSHPLIAGDECPTTGEKDCRKCSGEFCETHGIEPCDCDSADRHHYDPTRPNFIYREPRPCLT
jgi:hypothetical protein